jgi:polyisoprenoid-binding protein YceI
MPAPDLLKSAMLLLLLAATAQAQNASPTNVVTGSCRVTFEGTSTLHAFAGEIASMPLNVVVHGAPDQPRTVHCELIIPVTSLTTRHKKRDRNMYAMFRADQFPKLHLRAAGVPLAALNPGEEGVAEPPRIPLGIEIGNVTNRIDARVVNRRVVDPGQEFDLECEISLSLFGLQRPSAMLGTVRVGDVVKVRARVKLDQPL